MNTEELAGLPDGCGIQAVANVRNLLDYPLTEIALFQGYVNFWQVCLILFYVFFWYQFIYLITKRTFFYFFLYQKLDKEISTNTKHLYFHFYLYLVFT